MMGSEHFQRMLTEFDEVDSQGCESGISAETLDGVPLEDQDAFLGLSLVDGVGYRTMCRLIHCFGTASRVLKAT